MHLTYVALLEVHGCLVYTERAEMAAVLSGTNHTRAVVGIQKHAKKKKKKKIMQNHMRAQ